MTHIVVLSGGIDSTAALAVTVEAGQHEVLAVTFDYNQRHEREIHSAIDVVRHYDVGHHLAELPLLHGSALLSEVPVPDGHYSDKTMALTVVQGRNLLFAAAAIAQTDPGDTVVFGVHRATTPSTPTAARRSGTTWTSSPMPTRSPWPPRSST